MSVQTLLTKFLGKHIFTGFKEIWGKVMFLLMFVCPQGGVCIRSEDDRPGGGGAASRGLHPGMGGQR